MDSRKPGSSKTRSTPDLVFLRNRYDKCPIPIAVELGEYHLDHTKRLYSEFNGDLLLPLLLGEISHYNLRHIDLMDGNFSRGGEKFRQQIDTNRFCNTSSISHSLNLPRETVRRKVAKLVAMGYLERVGSRGLRVTPAVSEHFVPEFNFASVVNLFVTYEKVKQLIDG